MGGRFAPESVAGFRRNSRPTSAGTGGRLRPEWVAGITGIRNFA